MHLVLSLCLLGKAAWIALNDNILLGNVFQHPAKGSVSPNPSQDSAAAGSQKEPVSQSVSIGLSSDGADAHAHQPQTLPYRGL